MQHDDSATHPPSPRDLTRCWVDLVNPSREQTARVLSERGVAVPSRDSLQEIESSSRTRADGQVLYLSMPLGVRDAGAAGVEPVPLGFILSPQLLVTVRYSEIQAFDAVRARVTSEPQMDSAAVFCTLIEAMVDYSADLLERISSDLATMSMRAFGRQVSAPPTDRRMTHALRASLTAVGSAADQLSRIRDSLLGLQRIIGFVSEVAAQWLAGDLKTRLQTARQDMISLVDFETHLSGKTQFLLDAVLGFINIEQNDIFKVLTIVSVVGIPPTLIASMYGMNFRGMPELSWHFGYAYGLTVIALSILTPILWFKRRGWW